MTIEEAVINGEELDILYETRKAIARQMDYCDNGHDLSSLSDKMMKLCERITELEKQNKPKKKTALSSVRAIRK